MSSQQSRQPNKHQNSGFDIQSTKTDDEKSVEDMLAHVDQFIEGVYRDLSLSPPRRTSMGNPTNLRSLDTPDAFSSSFATSARDTLPITTKTREKTPACSPVARRNMDTEIERINQICDNVDQNLRSIGVFMNTASPSSITESLSNTNSQNCPSSSTSTIIVNSTNPLVSSVIRRRNQQNTTSGETAAESFIDLSNLQFYTPEIFRQPVNPRNDADDDDVILVSANIPDVVDLCTPDSHQVIRRRRHYRPLSRRRLHEDSAVSETDSCCEVPSSPRKRRTESLDNSCLLISETTLATRNEGRTPFMCPVCMESCLQRQPTSTVCGHVFCRLCIKNAIIHNRKCPMCNKQLSQKQTFRIYL